MENSPAWLSWAREIYATVKIDVRGAVICNGKILLVQEKADGRWSMPGGWADLCRPAYFE